MKHIRAEELFHLAKVGIEMNNVARQTPEVLATARSAYDAELAAMKANVIQANGYEPYPIIFDRVTPWEIKEPLLKREGNKAGKTGTRTAPLTPRLRASSRPNSTVHPVNTGWTARADSIIFSPRIRCPEVSSRKGNRTPSPPIPEPPFQFPANSNRRRIMSHYLPTLKNTLASLGLCILSLAVSSTMIAAAENPSQQKPNIILILADDLGYADIGVHGCKDIPTPPRTETAH